MNSSRIVESILCYTLFPDLFSHITLTYKILKGIANQLNADSEATDFPLDETSASGSSIVCYLKRGI